MLDVAVEYARTWVVGLELGVLDVAVEYARTWVVGLEFGVFDVAVEHGGDGGLGAQGLVLLPLHDVALVVRQTRQVVRLLRRGWPRGLREPHPAITHH